MNNPEHPGALVREDCINELGITVKDAAERLGVSRQALSNVINEHASVSAEMALRFEEAGWGTAELWVQMQASYDLAGARQQKFG